MVVMGGGDVGNGGGSCGGNGGNGGAKSSKFEDRGSVVSPLT